MVCLKRLNINIALLILVITTTIVLSYTTSSFLNYVEAKSSAQINPDKGIELEKKTLCKLHSALYTLSRIGAPMIYTASCDECQRSEDCPYYPLQICVRECVNLDQSCYHNCLIDCGVTCAQCTTPCIFCITKLNPESCYTCISCVSASCLYCASKCRESCCTWCRICKWKDYNVHSLHNSSLAIGS